MSTAESGGDGHFENKQKTDQSENDDRLTLSANIDSLVKIMPLLTVKEQFRMERVCKPWQSAAMMSHRTVKTLDLSECLPSDPSWRYQSGGFRILESVTDSLGLHLRSLSVPDYPRGHLGQRELLLLSTKCPELQHLSFELTTKNLRFLEQLGRQMSQLNSLKLRYSGRIGCISPNAFEKRMGISLSSMANLKHFEIECPSVGFHGPLDGTFLAGLPNSIDSVSITHLRRVVDEKLANFIRLHPGLKHFEMNSVYGFTIGHELFSRVPALLARYCAGLKSLKIAGYQSFYFQDSTPIGEAFRSLTQLEQIDVAPNCFVTDSDLKLLCANCPNVSVLRIGNQHLCGWIPDVQSTPLLSLDGLNHIGKLKKLKFVSLDCFQITITAEIVSALCDGRGAKVEDFHFCTNREPNGWQKFTEEEMSNFLRATNDQRYWKFFRIEVDQIGRRVWLKQSTDVFFQPISMELLNP